MATKASSPKRRSTPASIPEASGTGMRDMPRSNQRVTPKSTMSAPETRKAPMAADMGSPAALVAMRAAPGVDQAVTTGVR